MTPDAVLMPRAHVAYSDVIDALSRGLISQDGAAAVVRMIFLLALPPIVTEHDE